MSATREPWTSHRKPANKKPYTIEARRAEGFRLLDEKPELARQELERRRKRHGDKLNGRETPAPKGDFFYVAALTANELRRHAADQ